MKTIKIPAFEFQFNLVAFPNPQSSVSFATIYKNTVITNSIVERKCFPGS